MRTFLVVAATSRNAPLTAGLFHVGVAQLLELLDQAVAVIALDLDHAVLHGAAGAALLLERAADLFELRARAVARRGWRSRPCRRDARFLSRCGWRAALAGVPGFMSCPRNLMPAPRGSQRSMRAAINASSSTARSRSRRICSGADAMIVRRAHPLRRARAARLRASRCQPAATRARAVPCS